MTHGNGSEVYTVESEKFKEMVSLYSSRMFLAIVFGALSLSCLFVQSSPEMWMLKSVAVWIGGIVLAIVMREYFMRRTPSNKGNLLDVKGCNRILTFMVFVSCAALVVSGLCSSTSMAEIKIAMSGRTLFDDALYFMMLVFIFGASLMAAFSTLMLFMGVRKWQAQHL